MVSPAIRNETRVYTLWLIRGMHATPAVRAGFPSSYEEFEQLKRGACLTSCRASAHSGAPTGKKQKTKQSPKNERNTMKTFLSVRWKDVRFTCQVIVTTLAAAFVPAAALADDPAGKAAAASAPAVSYSNPGGIGVGAIVGEPTGFTMKAWLSDKSAFDAGLGWSLDHNAAAHIYGDYLWHVFDLIQVERGKMPVYFGVGGRALFERNRDNRVGIRAPVGVSYLCDKQPVEVFAELAPIIDVAPSTKFDLSGGVGVRYYFR